MFATLRSIRLLPVAPVARRLLDQAIGIGRLIEPQLPAALRVAGFDLDARQPTRWMGSIGAFTLGLLCVFSTDSDSLASATAIFLIALALRFGFLFTSFGPRGIASRLSARFGTEQGHVTYAMALDLLLFAQRVGFVALACATAREPSGWLGHALRVLGLPVVAVGIAATVWAVRTIGHDAYHYRDLFTGARSVSLEDDGPYASCSNPMYVLGPLAGYGVAMLALSPSALLCAGVNQALLLAFNKAIEQPRLRRANGIYVETQRRYELARSLLGFDPRFELSRLRHADASEPPAAVDESRMAS